MDEDELSLWARYREGDEKVLEELVCFYLYLVKRWANRISRKAPWADREDLMQDGVIGLIKAIQIFDPNRGVEFETYAQYRICEAIYDSLELTRSLPRQQYENARKVKDVTDQMAQELGRMPGVEEVAERAGLTVRQVEKALDALCIAFAGALPETEELSEMYKDIIEGQERTALIEEAISQLDERERYILICYYLHGHSTTEIAKELDLTEENVRSIRKRSLTKLRKKLDSGRGGGRDDA